jgi:hypothetical protein
MTGIVILSLAPVSLSISHIKILISVDLEIFIYLKSILFFIRYLKVLLHRGHPSLPKIINPDEKSVA